MHRLSVFVALLFPMIMQCLCLTNKIGILTNKIGIWNIDGITVTM